MSVNVMLVLVSNTRWRHPTVWGLATRGQQQQAHTQSCCWGDDGGAPFGQLWVLAAALPRPLRRPTLSPHRDRLVLQSRSPPSILKGKEKIHYS